MCQLAQVSRAGYYRFLQRQAPEEEELALRSVIQQIVLENRGLYGYRRVTIELRRRGMMGAVLAFESPGHGSRVRSGEVVVKVICHSEMVEENTFGWDE